VDALGRSEVSEGLAASGEADGDGAHDAGEVEDGDGHRVTDRDEVAGVDEGVDGGDVAVLGEPAEQGLGGVAVLGRLGAEPGEGAAPGGDGGEVR
jgi:hypothetical protein